MPKSGSESGSASGDQIKTTLSVLTGCTHGGKDSVKLRLQYDSGRTMKKLLRQASNCSFGFS